MCKRESIYLYVYLCVNVYVYGSVGIYAYICVHLSVCVCCGNRTKVVYSELTIAKESTTITCVWPRLKSRQGVGKLFSGKKASGVP